MAVRLNNTMVLADGGGGSTKKSTWSSYQEAANAGYSNIMTQSEWARRKSSSGYSTYSAYLQAMYNKYVGNKTSTPSTPSTPTQTTVGGITVNKEIRDPNYNSWNSAGTGTVTPSTGTVSTPTPVTPSAVGGIVGSTQKPTTLTPTGSNSVKIDTSYAANAMVAGAAMAGAYDGGGNKAVTDEGVVTNPSTATPMPTIDTSYGSNTISRVDADGNTTPVVTPTSASTKTTTSTAGGSSGSTTTPTTSTPAADAGTASEPIDTYEEYLRKNDATYKSIYDEQTKYYDEQNQQTLAAIEEQRQAALAEAENQKNLLYEAAETSKNNAYTHADAQLAADLGYSQEQYETLIASIIANKESGMALAESQKQALLSMSEEQRNAVYAQAEKKYAEEIAYAQSQYSTLIDAINAQYSSGVKLAEEQRDLLLSMSEEMRNQVYKAAELQRLNSYTNAEVERERSVVDARSSYEQNKATYGANAEAMAGMGLTGSGYGDYINSQAYAQQRAETQSANAEAAAVKRDADYTESQAKLGADNDYLQNKYNAESEYADRIYEIDTTYQNNKLTADQNLADAEFAAKQAESDSKAQADAAHRENTYKAESEYADRKYEIDTTYASNMASAEAQKSQMDQEAQTKADDAKYEADQAYNENKYAADTTYSTNVAEAEAAARQDTLTANQKADEGKNNAYLSYQENILNNNNTIAAYKEQTRQDAEKAAKEEETYANNAYLELLGGANTGAYSAEQLAQLAKDWKLSSEQTQSLIDAANAYSSKKTEADDGTSFKNKQEISTDIGINSDAYTESDIDDYVNNGYLTNEDGAELKEDLAKARVDEVKYYISSGDISYATTRIEELYGEKKIDDDTRQSLYFDICQRAMNNVTEDAIDATITDLKKYKNAGKISEADYNNLTKYMFSRFGTAVSPTESGFKYNEKKAGQKWQTYTINGTNYWADSKENKDTETQAMLNGIATGNKERTPSIGTLVRYNGTTYAYVSHIVEYGFLNLKSKSVTEWTEIHDNYGNDDYGASVEKNASENELPTPSHQAGGKWESYQDAANAGYSNIMTQTEWVRRKSSTGCNTYKEYLDKMYQKYVG